MSLKNLDRDQFSTRLNEFVFPARPIDSLEHLQGRREEVQELERALAIVGRHVFIYGDRGVGKSSLAATLAAQLQSSDATPINVSGSPTETFSSVVLNIIGHLIGQSRTHTRTVSRETSKGLGAHGTSLGRRESETLTENLFENESLGIAEAAELIAESVHHYASDTVVVIDEFDRIGDAAERNKFADLLKHLGDAQTPIRIIFTGIGRSLEELLGAHGSAIRQLHTKQLDRLSYDGRWDIALQIANAFELDLPRDIYVRIAAISDGFPYYVHLMMEKILWQALDAEEIVDSITTDMYVHGLREAINSINAELRRPYELVLYQRTQDYEPVLWATANGDELHSPKAYYYASYKSIMRQLNKDPMNKRQFDRRIKSLQSDALGPILTRDPYIKQQYMYTEKMFRGYVRMQAEANGIQLYGREAKGPSQKMHVPSRVATGYRGATVPAGVEFSKKRKKS